MKIKYYNIIIRPKYIPHITQNLYSQFIRASKRWTDYFIFNGEL